MKTIPWTGGNVQNLLPVVMDGKAWALSVEHTEAGLVFWRGGNMAIAKSKQARRASNARSLAESLTEKLDLSVLEPPPTKRLSLHSHDKARYEDAKWVLEPGGEMMFRLELAAPEHTFFTMEFYTPFETWIAKLAERVKTARTPWAALRGYNNPANYRPILHTNDNDDFTISLGYSRLNPLSHDFIIERALLPPDKLFPGVNFLAIRLSDDPGVAPLYLKSVSVSDFSVQLQQNTQWCWAAVLASLMDFYGHQSSQSQLVKRVLQQGQDKLPDDLNRTFELPVAARGLGFVDQEIVRNVSRARLRDLVNDGVPVPIQINWRNNGRKNGKWGEGHYVVVVGVSNSDAAGETVINIEDPWVGKVTLTWNELKTEYPGRDNQKLYRNKHEESYREKHEQCPTWSNNACHCRWRGEWEYTYVPVPKEWVNDDDDDDDKYSELLSSFDQQLTQLAERDGFQETLVKAKKEPTLLELRAQIKEHAGLIKMIARNLADISHAYQKLINKRDKLRMADSIDRKPSERNASQLTLEQAKIEPTLAGMNAQIYEYNRQMNILNLRIDDLRYANKNLKQMRDKFKRPSGKG